MDEFQLERILNYRRISEKIATAGQPSEGQLLAISESGFEIVINLGLENRDYSLPDEKALVESLGLEYVHIPVEWEKPTPQDFHEFVSIVKRNKDRNLFIHCAANKRVSVFVALYRISELGRAREAALLAVQEIWEPNEIWKQFVLDILEHGASSG